MRLNVFADYYQFYFWDGDDKYIKAPEDYTNEDVEKRIKISPGVVVIQPERNMEVPVEVEVWNEDPGFSAEEWQHIGEAPLAIQGRHIEINECTGYSLAWFEAPSQKCCLRALFKGLDTLSEDRLDGKDFYKVQIFPSDIEHLQILKQFPLQFEYDLQ